MTKKNTTAMQQELELTKEDKEFFQLRLLFLQYIGEEKVVNAIKKSIDDSEIFEPYNKRSFKFFGYRNPNLVLKYDVEKMLKKYDPDGNIDYESELKKDETVKWVSSATHSELLSPISNFFSAELEKFLSEDIDNIKKKFGKSHSTLVGDLKIISNIYSVIIDKENDKVHITYVFSFV